MRKENERKQHKNLKEIQLKDTKTNGENLQILRKGEKERSRRKKKRFFFF